MLPSTRHYVQRTFLSSGSIRSLSANTMPNKLTPPPLSSLDLSVHHVPPSPSSPATLPLLVYHQVFPGASPSALESHLRNNGFPPQWRYPMYPFSHFHSTTHEALAVFAGRGKLRFGGDDNPNAIELDIKAGDVMLLPTGLAHRAVKLEDNFEMVGSYPTGCEWDTMRGGEQGVAERMEKVKPLDKDPVYGSEGPALEYMGANVKEKE